jgi:hypothetical protein
MGMRLERPAGPLAVHRPGYRAELERLGYTRDSIRGHLVVPGQLDRFMLAGGSGLSDLDEKQTWKPRKRPSPGPPRSAPRLAVTSPATHCLPSSTHSDYPEKTTRGQSGSQCELSTAPHNRDLGISRLIWMSR